MNREREPAWWFVFCGDKLLVKSMDKVVTIPCVTDLGKLNLQPIRKQYLGTQDGRPCYSAECADGVLVPEGMEFKGLRGLFGLMKEDLFQRAGYAIQIMNWDRTNQYCGRCGTPTEESAEERAKVCPECGFVRFPRISPAIIVAVLRGNQILLARANRFPYKFYSVLAGFVEPGESLEECLKREVKEEVGVEVKNICYFGSQSWPFPNSLMVAFTADYAKGKITVDENEIAEADWFTANKLPRIPDKISIARRLIDWFVENHQ